MEETIAGNSKPLLMMKGLLLSYGITGLLLLFLAFLLFKMGLGENQVNLGILIIYIISCISGGFYVGKKVRVRRFLWGMFAGTGYALLLTLLTLTAQKGAGLDIKETVMMFFLCIVGGALGGVMS